LRVSRIVVGGRQGERRGGQVEADGLGGLFTASRRRRALCGVLAAAGGALALGAGVAGAGAVAGCGASGLALKQGGRVVPKTMQLPLLLELVNRGAGACTLEGYPRVQLRSSSGALYGFSYRDSGDAEVTALRPALVTLRPGGSAWVLLNKTPCIGNVDGRLARQVWLMAPGTKGFLRLRLGNVVLFDYCGPGDPGHTIDVSPLEPTAGATVAPASSR
jgi:hypothetical protein